MIRSCLLSLEDESSDVQLHWSRSSLAALDVSLSVNLWPSGQMWFWLKASWKTEHSGTLSDELLLSFTKNQEWREIYVQTFWNEFQNLTVSPAMLADTSDIFHGSLLETSHNRKKETVKDMSNVCKIKTLVIILFPSLNTTMQTYQCPPGHQFQRSHFLGRWYRSCKTPDTLTGGCRKCHFSHMRDCLLWCCAGVHTGNESLKSQVK